MKLLYLANLRMPTEKAYGIQIVEMCKAFAGLEIEVELIHPLRKNLIKENIFEYYSLDRNFRVRTIWSPDFYLLGAFNKLTVNFKSFLSAGLMILPAINSKADVIYSRDEWPLYFISFFKKNIVFEAHKFSSARMFFYKRFLARKVKIVAISGWLKNKFLEMGFLSEDIIVAHDGVDLKKFDIQISKEEARRKLNLSENAKIVMYTGHLFDWKGADILAATAEILPDVLFVFVGGTKYDVETFTNKFGNFPNISIIGYKSHDKMPVFLKAADILSLPNSSKDRIYESTSPLKLFEYMASKRPIIASNLPSIAEILNNSNAVMVKPDDKQELADGIRRLLNNKEIQIRLADRAFSDVLNYSWIKRAEKIITFFKK